MSDYCLFKDQQELQGMWVLNLFGVIVKSQKVYLLGSKKRKGWYAHYLAFEIFSLPILLINVKQISSNDNILSCQSALGDKVSVTNVFWYFLSRNIGCLLLLVSSLFALNYTYHQNEYKQQVIASPEVGDVYFADLHDLYGMKDGEFRYGLLVISEIQNNEVYFQIGNVLHNNPASPFTQLTKGAYTGESLLGKNEVILQKQYIQQFYKNGVIYNVKRPAGELIDGWIPTRFIRPHDRQFQRQFKPVSIKLN